ncbi:acyl carrier protein [Butyricimonas sp. Marseille-P3923]|uniref:acyl carrier protein n=1 Tax=Butyricimonas sp. Marseille-P3923 TaxID=1987504 RepID=UPI000C086255|nr:acyl carrier protein [Butyricimonas sp. Marseille-P3923]
MKNFIEKFIELFEETAPDVFRPNTKFRELDEWSSLIALALISMIDEEYDVVLNGEDIREALTIEDLYNKVLAKK